MFSVIFQVRPADGQRDAYLAEAGALKPELETIEGFIDNERFESRNRPGWLLSLSTWRDEKSVIRWRRQAKHHFTQEKGRSGIFSDYRLRVGEITSDTAPPLPIRETRFDATEIGRAKACSLLEWMPQADERGDGPERTAPGLEDVEVFDSIYVPGKVLVLGLWTSEAAAASVRASGAASVRLRTVRVIREYGMFDRRETPQYFPKVARPT